MDIGDINGNAYIEYIFAVYICITEHIRKTKVDG